MLPTSGQMPAHLMLISMANSPAVVDPYVGFDSQAVAEEHHPTQGLKPLTPLSACSWDNPMSTTPSIFLILQLEGFLCFKTSFVLCIKMVDKCVAKTKKFGGLRYVYKNVVSQVMIGI